MRELQYGPNALATHHARFAIVLWHQLRSPLLALLLAAALASYIVGERSSAVIIAVIVGLSVGLGFVNEFRAERAAESLHAAIHHRCVVVRDGAPVLVDVTTLVPGDVVELKLGEIVPADVRLIDVAGSSATSPSLPASRCRSPSPRRRLRRYGARRTGVLRADGHGRARRERSRCRRSDGHACRVRQDRRRPRHASTRNRVPARPTAILDAVGVRGRRADHLDFRHQRRAQRPIIDALLFSLAIAVGITPQLLPAVVSTSLAAGSRRMRQRKVLVKRLVCIEDLGDVETLFTDKTGTLTRGQIDYMRAVPTEKSRSDDVLRWGLLCTESSRSGGDAVGGNALDQALWDSPASAHVRGGLAGYTRLAVLPFDHERRLVSVLVKDAPTAKRGGHEGCARSGPRALRRSRRRPKGAGRGVRRRQPGGRRRDPCTRRPRDADRGRRSRSHPGRLPRLPGPAEARRARRPASAGRPGHSRQGGDR